MGGVGLPCKPLQPPPHFPGLSKSQQVLRNWGWAASRVGCAMDTTAPHSHSPCLSTAIPHSSTASPAVLPGHSPAQHQGQVLGSCAGQGGFTPRSPDVSTDPKPPPCLLSTTLVQPELSHPKVQPGDQLHGVPCTGPGNGSSQSTASKQHKPGQARSGDEPSRVQGGGGGRAPRKGVMR